MSKRDALVRQADEAADKVRAADAALKRAVEDRLAAGAVNAGHALRELATWVPGGFPHKIDLYTGRKMARAEEERLRTAPFVSEAYLYALLGKEDARTFLALFNSICRSLGFADGYDEFQRPWFEAQLAEDREHARRAILHVKKLREVGHTFTDGKARRGKRGKKAIPCPACPTHACQRRRALVAEQDAISKLRNKWDEGPPVVA